MNNSSTGTPATESLKNTGSEIEKLSANSNLADSVNKDSGGRRRRRRPKTTLLQEKTIKNIDAGHTLSVKESKKKKVTY